MSTFTDLLETDLATMIDVEAFGVTVNYAGTSIPAIIRYSGQIFQDALTENPGVVLLIKASDVAAPQRGDAVIYDSKNYQVTEVIGHDGLKLLWEVALKQAFA